MSISLWREMLYAEMSKLQLSGEILDLGGSRKSKYHSLIGGEHTITVANIDAKDEHDLYLDLEHLFPTKEASYDAILCINVLEHVFDYQNVLAESYRTLRQNGTIVVAVPFLIRVHPSPHDYWRFTAETLEKLFSKAGYKDVEIHTIGTGVCGAAYSLRHNLYRVKLVQNISKTLARSVDLVLRKIRRESSFTKEYYPLGYVLIAKK